MGTDERDITHNKYLVVEQYVRSAIQSGLFQHDERLPSIRRLQQELSVSKNTVIRAYQELEAQGWVYSVERSGYRVKPALISPERTHTKPTKVDLLSVCKEFLTYPHEKEQLPTGSAHPNIDAPAIKSLYAEIGRHSRRQSQLPSHYQLPPGDTLLVKQLAKITADLGVPVQLSEIITTHGAQQAISLALRATTVTGDIVAVESPCYFGNLLLLESLGLNVLEIPSCPKTGMEVDALAKAMEEWPIKAILVTPNFTNPTGATMTLEKRLALLQVSHDVPIIEDDVFGALSFEEPLPTLKSLDKADRVIYVNSLSKTLDSRLRIGWLLAGRYQAQIEKLLLCDNMGSLNLMQSAIASFLTTGKYRAHTARMRRQYQCQSKRFHAMLSKALNQIPALENRYQLHLNQGSFLLWLILPEGVDSHALYLDCRKEKISLLPGTVFGTHNQYQHCVRFCVANFSHDRDWTHPISQLANLINHHSHKAVT
ncbi:PLP-dependent aminotransferase family protein [Vibrio vulnificus]|uniref:aminotransferase-like domain-containing protein n=1 Tax=Vibrio vulnificus TaxID=672 RepID=UPI0002FD3E96|nr:PLP-dependent aminotransferase family protein [Vibrio vulnificus]EGQ7983097.1 PLP-dependent aminotransferase family protein [Vibrio vulnificus]EGQ9993239.1 PLP-dependent aminotransferase family protein [Vibrio vulnificus]EHZ7123242.1 PLP-dependent aminotransferase family protein [Vibrio vulnificus]EKO5199155.1 PLP-dependent aminotransferase family protein [Vibrio vulnificus]MCU8360043.1 PLP-dependent aminotransferase family protein [Vibrio vulnificus]